MTHATFMRAGNSYQKAIKDGNVDKARRALVRLAGVSVRQYKGKPVEGVHMYPMLRSVRKFNAKNMIKARSAVAAVKAA